MAKKKYVRQIQRHDTLLNWQLYNPVLKQGEIGIAYDVNNVASIKVGDGLKSWVELPYVIQNVSPEELTSRVEALERDITKVKGDIQKLYTVIGIVEQGKTIADIIAEEKTDITSLLERVENIEHTQQQTVIEKITAGGTMLEIFDKTVNIPVATDTLIGLVRGSTGENKVKVLEDGTMEVDTLNINKVVQTEGEELLLNCN